jgi:hypothetical protein
MKKIKLITCLLVGTFLVSQTTLSNSIIELIKQGIFKFETKTIDYGTIEQHSDGYRSFIFTNVGDAPIVISKVKGSCGCTVPTKPDGPIASGETAEIRVRYATDRVGSFEKKVIIYSDAFGGEKVVKIKGNVIKSEPGVSIKKNAFVRTKN